MRLWLLIGSVSALLAVLIGAIGAHSLKPLLNAEGIINYNTASNYQFWHSISLIICGLLWPYCGPEIIQRKYLSFAACFLLLGIILFCGNLYILAIWGTNPAHMLIPIGGLSFIAGWTMIILSVLRIGK